MPMHIGQPLQRLEYDVSDLHLRQRLLQFLHQLVHVLVQKLEYEVQLVVEFDQFVQVDDVGVVELNQCSNLLQVDAVVPLRVFALHPLYCDNLAGLSIDGFDHRAEGAVAQHLTHFVLIHFNIMEGNGCHYQN